MATGAIILRPSADIETTTQHSTYPGLSANLYTLINEEVADGDSTYIYAKGTPRTSKFQLSSGTIPPEATIIDVTICAVPYSQNEDEQIFRLEVNGIQATETPTLYPGQAFNGSVPSAITLINNYFIVNKTLPPIVLILLSEVTNGANKSDSKDSGITQVYVVLTYEVITDIGIHKKVNGTWKAATAAYKKVNGAWAEITADEAKEIISSRLIKRTYNLRNLAVDGSFEDALNNWNCWLAEPTDTSQAKDGSCSLKLGGDALAGSKGAIPLVAGHKYYGREYIKTAGELTAADCRFELCGAVDGVEKAFVFGWNRGNYPDWTIISDVITVDGTYTDGFGLRTFTVGGSVNAWVDSIVVIDLTEAFGAGQEPSKEWCDLNIPYFDGEYCLPYITT